MTLSIIIVFLILLLILTVKSVIVVRQGYNYTVERFGRYTMTLRPGLCWIIPFVDRIGRKVNMMECIIDMPRQEVITCDNASVSVDGVIFFQVLDAAKASYEVEALHLAILNLSLTNTRTVMGSLDLDSILSQRDVINYRLLTVIDAATSAWGIKVTRIEIRDIHMPPDLTLSMARQMKAERAKRAIILESEGKKQAMILSAEGKKIATFLEAESRERSAEAEAKSAVMVNDAVSSGSGHALNYFIAQKYIDAFGKLAAAPNQKVLMMPVESASIMGAIGGIAEIVKSAFDGDMQGKKQVGVSKSMVPQYPIPSLDQDQDQDQDQNQDEVNAGACVDRDEDEDEVNAGACVDRDEDEDEVNAGACVDRDEDEDEANAGACVDQDEVNAGACVDQNISSVKKDKTAAAAEVECPSK